MFAVVVTIFLICWFPYHSYFVYAYHNKDIVVKPYVQDLFLSFYWLAMSNSMVNPIIYYWMNPRWVPTNSEKEGLKNTILNLFFYTSSETIIR